MGPGASSDTLKNRNISWPCRGSNPTPSPDCRLVTALTMQFHLLKPDISTWSIWMVLSDITWHLCHSTYISVSETEHSMGHSKIQFTVTSSSIMYFSRFSQQLLKCWVSLRPLLCTGIYLFQSLRNILPLSTGWLNGIQAMQWKKMCQRDKVLIWGSCRNNVTSGMVQKPKRQPVTELFTSVLVTVCWECYWLQYISVTSFWLHLLQY